MTEKELYDTFFGKDAEELIYIINGDDYTSEAIEIAKKVIEDRGGIEKIDEEINYKIKKIEDGKRLVKIINEELRIYSKDELQEVTLDISSDYYSKEELEELLSLEKDRILENYHSNKLTIGRIIRVFIGVLLTSIISAGLLYLIFSQDKTRIPVIMFLPVIGVNYLMIRVISGVKKLNAISITSNIIALILSFLLLRGFVWLFIILSLQK